MIKTVPALGIVTAACVLCHAQASLPSYRTLRLSDQFYCEGAYYGDFNRDGKPDLVSGPFWYEGPDFQQKHQVYPPKAFDGATGYSDNFLTFAGDFNGDGWADILYVGFPARETYWYENPAGKSDQWKKHLAHPSVGGESPIWGDVTGDGKEELVFVFDGHLGYAGPDTARPDQPWKFIPITPKLGYGQFTHGTGIGDINGDGLVDILEANGWWEQPARVQPGQPWIQHLQKFADAAAQILVTDVDGDGRNDVITARHCHLYGIDWFRQTRDASGRIGFERHVIIGQKPEENAQGLRFSQAHAFDLADFDGDGVRDFVVGKRFWAHGDKGDVEPNAPAVLYWFQVKREPQKPVRFIGHLIHDDSGVGTQVVAVDLNGDKVPDVIVGNKKGTFVSLSQARPVGRPAR